MNLTDRIINNANFLAKNNSTNDSIDFLVSFEKKYNEYIKQKREASLKVDRKEKKAVGSFYDEDFTTTAISHYITLTKDPNFTSKSSFEYKLHSFLNIIEDDIIQLDSKIKDPAYQNSMKDYKYEEFAPAIDNEAQLKGNETDININPPYHTYTDIDNDDIDIDDDLSNDTLKALHNSANKFLYIAENTKGTSLYDKSKKALDYYNDESPINNSPDMLSNRVNLLNSYLALQKRSENRGFLGFFKFVTRIKEYFLKKDIEKTLIEKEDFSKEGLEALTNFTTRTDNLDDKISINKYGTLIEFDDNKTVIGDDDDTQSNYDMENESFHLDLEVSSNLGNSQKLNNQVTDRRNNQIDDKNIDI